jgi:hypothetical protein
MLGTDRADVAQSAQRQSDRKGAEAAQAIELPGRFADSAIAASVRRQRCPRNRRPQNACTARSRGCRALQCPDLVGGVRRGIAIRTWSKHGTIVMYHSRLGSVTPEQAYALHARTLMDKLGEYVKSGAKAKARQEVIDAAIRYSPSLGTGAVQDLPEATVMPPGRSISRLAIWSSWIKAADRSCPARPCSKRTHRDRTPSDRPFSETRWPQSRPERQKFGRRASWPSWSRH